MSSHFTPTGQLEELKFDIPELITLGISSFIVLLLIIRNISLYRGNWIDIFQLLAGILLIFNYITCIVDSLFYDDYSICLPAKYLRYSLFVMFQIMCNIVLCFRITVLVPRKYQLSCRIAIGFIFSVAISLISAAAFLSKHPSNCTMSPIKNSNRILMVVGKLIQAIMYIFLWFCFFIPFNRVLRRIEDTTIITTQLQKVSDKVAIQMAIPIFTYLLCSINGLVVMWHRNWVSYIIQDLSVFLAMTFTYGMNGKKKTTDQENNAASDSSESAANGKNLFV